MCARVCTCAHMFLSMCTYLLSCRSQRSVSGVTFICSSHTFGGTGSLTDPRVHWSARLPSQWAFGIGLSLPPSLGWPIQASSLGFLHGSGNLHSDLHACMASTLSVEQSTQPSIFDSSTACFVECELCRWEHSVSCQKAGHI